MCARETCGISRRHHVFDAATGRGVLEARDGAERIHRDVCVLEHVRNIPSCRDLDAAAIEVMR